MRISMPVEECGKIICNGGGWKDVDWVLGYSLPVSLTEEEARKVYLASLRWLKDNPDGWACNPHFDRIWSQIVESGVAVPARQLSLTGNNAPWELVSA